MQVLNVLSSANKPKQESRVELPLYRRSVQKQNIRSGISLLPTTAEAKQWKGYGTTLKPGWEPCVMAMKPLSSTFAENAATYGVAGLNIEGSRIGTDIVGWGGGAPERTPGPRT
jgi:hypothetical protein